MRRRNIQLFLLLGVLAMTSLFSCGVDRWPEYYKWTGRDLWIDSVMREEYLWFEDIPNTKDLNYFLEPDAFLKKIISPLDKGYSSVDTLYATPLPISGHPIIFALNQLILKIQRQWKQRNCILRRFNST